VRCCACLTLGTFAGVVIAAAGFLVLIEIADGRLLEF